MNPFAQILAQAPRTQQDIQYLAQAAAQAQSPEVQRQLAEARQAAYTGGAALMTLQAVQTLALLGILYFLWKKA